MPARLPTPHVTAVRPVTGHFRTESDYGTWRPAGTDDFLLVYTVAGTGRFTAATGKTLETAAGDAILLRPHTFHDYATPPGFRWELLWAHFSPRADWLDLLAWPAPWPGIHRLPRARPVGPLMARLHRATQTADPLRDRLVDHALEGVLLACARLNPARPRSATDGRLRAVLEHIAAHLHRPLTVDDLAGVTDLSPSRLAHLFRAALGVPVMAYVENRRIDRAAELLRRTPLSVKEIARQTGFASPFYFSLRFKKATGKSPSQYREDVA